MSRIHLHFLIAIFGAGSLHADTEPAEDSDIPSLINQVIKAASPQPGVGAVGQRLSAKLARHDHRKVIEALLPLLESKQDGVPDLSSYMILHCMDGLIPDDLDALKKGFRNGGGWLPCAIASLKSDDAAEFLAKEFRANPEIQGQVDGALVALGDRAIPYLLAGLSAANPHQEIEYFDGIRSILHAMNGKGERMIPGLMKLAQSKDIDVKLRQQAALSVGFVGLPAEPVIPALRALASSEPEVFAEVVRQSIITSGTVAAAEALADRVDQNPDHFTIGDIASLGKRAEAVGPRVLGWLNHPDWDCRVRAARTIGAIGYQPGRPALERLLSSKNDWRLVNAAVASLADLNAKESIPALTETAKNHWFSFVRDTASSAVTELQGEAKLPNHKLKSLIESLDCVLGGPVSLAIEADKIPGLSERKESGGRNESFADFKEREPEIARRFIRLRNTNGEGMLGSIISLATGNGRLLGADAGEWVGGLQYAPENGEQQLLLMSNIAGIEKWHDEILIASGMCHMSTNQGIIQKLVSKNGKVGLEPWFVLPGCPAGMWTTKTNQLVIECFGGTMVLSTPQDFQCYSKPFEAKPSDANNSDPFAAPPPK